MPTSVEEIYEHIVKGLNASERRRLAERIISDLVEGSGPGESSTRHNWMSIRGIAPNLLAGEDAQEWVSRTRRESDERREESWGAER